MENSNKDHYKRIQDKLPNSPLRGYWCLAKGQKLPLLCAIIFQGLSSLCFTMSFFLIKYFTDTILIPNNWSFPVIYLTLGFIFLHIFSGLFMFLSGRIGARSTEIIVQSVRNSLFDHIQKLSFTFHDTMKTGELIQRSTSDVEAVKAFFSDQVIGIAHIFFLFSINFGAILLLNWQLALISIIAVPIVLLLSRNFFKWIFSSYEDYQEQDAMVSSVLQENLSGIRVVRAFARGEFEKEKFEEENIKKFECGKRLMIYHALYWPVSHIICGLQTVGGILIACIMTLNGMISLGTLIAFCTLINRIIWPMQQMGRLLSMLSRSSVSFERIASILDEPRESLKENSLIEKKYLNGEIHFNNVWFFYEKDRPVLKNINFSVSPGEVIALLGEAGSGKTSLVNLLPRFYDYSRGEILLDGYPLERYSRHFLRESIGIVEQEPFLFSLSIRENIAYGMKKEVSDEEIEAVARAAAIHSSIMELPEGYNTIVGEKGVTLSGGQKQRIAIARAMLKNPRILILDDSTSSVDAETEEKIREAIRNLMKGKTTFIIAHRIRSLMMADTILVFRQGEIIQHGTHSELLKANGFYKEVFELQTQIEVELQQELL